MTQEDQVELEALTLLADAMNMTDMNALRHRIHRNPQLLVAFQRVKSKIRDSRAKEQALRASHERIQQDNANHRARNKPGPKEGPCNTCGERQHAIGPLGCPKRLAFWERKK